MAHARLSILDLEARSNQPFSDYDGSTMVFNGEIYNFQDIKQTMFAEQSFDTKGDTEVLFRALCDNGGEAIKHFAGMWAFCFWNAKQQNLLVGRDRYGKKPLFYYKDDEMICFASAIKPILHYLNKRASFTSQAVLNYLCYGYLFPSTDGQTHVPSIKQIKPSHYAKFCPKTWEHTEKRYFNLADEVKNNNDTSPKALCDVFKSAVTSRLVSDRPVELLLSGGIDSTLILSALVAEGL